MARVQVSALISNISGKLNGSVFQRTQGGLIIRNQSAKINSNTSRSNLHRVGITIIQNSWQQLSNTNRLLWETYAIFLNKKQKNNPTLNVSGQQLFIYINSIRLALSNVNTLFIPWLLSTPVLVAIPQAIKINLIVINFGDITVTFDRAIDDSKEVVILFLSRPLTASQQSPNQKLTLMKSTTLNGYDFICTSYYAEVYGRVLNAGEYVQARVAVYNTDNQSYSAYYNQRFLVS